MAELILKVLGMNCEHCKMTVERVIKSVSGVSNAFVDLKTNTATVQFDPDMVAPEKIIESVNKSGYIVERVSS